MLSRPLLHNVSVSFLLRFKLILSQVAISVSQVLLLPAVHTSPHLALLQHPPFYWWVSSIELRCGRSRTRRWLQVGYGDVLPTNGAVALRAKMR